MTDKITEKQEKSMEKRGRMAVKSGSRALVLCTNGTSFCTMNFVRVDDLIYAFVGHIDHSQ